MLALSYLNGFSQLINEPTHIQTDSTSCNDLILFLNQIFLVNSEVHSSLHSNCRHQIIYSLFNLNIAIPPHTISKISMGLLKSWSKWY